MSKSPLLEENVVRRWAKYAGIQDASKGLISEMYEPMEEGAVKEDKALEEDETLEEDALEERTKKSKGYNREIRKENLLRKNIRRIIKANLQEQKLRRTIRNIIKKTL